VSPSTTRVTSAFERGDPPLVEVATVEVAIGASGVVGTEEAISCWFLVGCESHQPHLGVEQSSRSTRTSGKHRPLQVEEERLILPRNGDASGLAEDGHSVGVAA
jgi:hypothetical protein